MPYFYTSTNNSVVSNAYITEPKNASWITNSSHIHIHLNYTVQYCISNQSYNKVAKVVIVVNTQSMQEITNVFQWTHNQLGLLISNRCRSEPVKIVRSFLLLSTRVATSVVTMLHLYIPAVSIPAFSIPGILAPRFPLSHFQRPRFNYM